MSNSHVRAVTTLIAMCLACAAQEDPKPDPFAELLSTLPPITQASNDPTTVEIRDGDRSIGWGRMDIEAKPDATGGLYLLRQHFVLQAVPNGETVAATLTAEVDARFRPRKVTIEQAVRDKKDTTKVRDTLETGEKQFTLGHVDEEAQPAVRMVALPRRPFVVGIEYLLPRLPREKLDGAVIVELDPQAGTTGERSVEVIGLPQGRASIVVKDVDGEREATYTVDANGHLQWLKQGTLVFSACTVERWEQLRTQFPDVE